MELSRYLQYKPCVSSGGRRRRGGADLRVVLIQYQLKPGLLMAEQREQDPNLLLTAGNS